VLFVDAAIDAATAAIAAAAATVDGW
jgi:hypothetical protein